MRDDVELAVRSWPATGATGTEPPILCVHGLASNARMWDGMAAELSTRGFEVAAVDQRGHGQSSKPDDGYDFSTLVEDLLKLIDELAFERPLVVGQSWGANVVLELGRRHPERVRGVVCVDGGFIELSKHFPTWDDCVAKMTPPALIGTPAARMEQFMRQANADWPEAGIQGALANFEVRDDGTIAPWLTLDRHLQILRHLYDHRPSQGYAEIDVPVLLTPADSAAVWSDKKVAIEEAAALLRRGRVRWFAPAHHDIHAQKPVELADAIHEALKDGFFA